MNSLDEKVCFWTVGKKDTYCASKIRKKNATAIFNNLDTVIFWKLY